MPTSSLISANPYTRLHQDLQDHPDWLPVITEGDSWFAFPGVLLRMNVVSHLQYTFRARMAFLRIAYHGDKLDDMLHGSQLRKLKRMFKKNVDFKLMLFSGGGNDIIQCMSKFVETRADCEHWFDCVRHDALDKKLTEIESLYIKLIKLRDKYNPDLPIYTHSYDYSSVNGRPVKFGGIVLTKAWLEPVFKRKGITHKQSQRKIVKHVIDKFYATLKRVEADHPERFVVVDTRGTLSRDDWTDEIHPSHEGFGLITQKIARRVAEDFPGYLSTKPFSVDL